MIPSLRLCLPGVAAILLAGGSLSAQVKSTAERIRDLEEENAKMKSKLKKVEDRLEKVEATEQVSPKDKKEPFYSDGVLTIGGIKLRFGGKAEILFIDSQSERDTTVGPTERPDPHFELNRLRLSPELLFSKEVSIESQIDFKPEDSRTILKEMYARYKPSPVWWFGADARIGLDDRFIRPARRTKNYPLIGNSFWRDESLSFQFNLRFGDKDGEPLPASSKSKKGAKAAAAEDAAADAESEAVEAEGEEVEIETQEGADPPVVTTKKKAARHGAFDFVHNLGELRTYFSVGNGNTLDNNEVGFDGADFNDLIQDDRNVTDSFTIREVGFGLGYRRNFAALGELEVLGFYYNDELSDASVEFLQEDLTISDVVTGDPVSGYGDSNSRKSYKYGVSADYFLSAEEFMPADWNPRGQDGIRLFAQWIRAQDGDFRRSGWYVQGSYRFSFPQRLLFDKYFRSIEPIVRYGTLDTNLGPDPLLPGTWDRRQTLVGMNLEVIKEVHVLCEYTFNGETTGGNGVNGPSSVRNDELMVELLLTF